MINKEVNQVRKTAVFLVILILILGLAIACAKPDSASDAKFPSKAITVIVPQSPGGGTDLVARVIAGSWGAYSDVTQKVVTMPGAGGVTGTKFVLNAAPDGHTILVTGSGAVMTVPLLNPEAGYKPEDVAPIALYGIVPHAFAVRAESPYKTLQDLINYAKANPSKLTWGSSGTGTTTHTETAVFMNKAGINTKHVPFEGTSEGLAAVMGGHVDAFTGGLSGMVSVWKEGKIRILAVMLDQRVEGYNLPTFKELGYDVPMLDCRAAWVSAKVPKERIKILSDIYQKVMADNSNISILKKMGEIPTFLAYDEFGKEYNRILEDFRPVAKVIFGAETK